MGGTPEGPIKTPTAQQALFQAVCDALGWDTRYVTKTVATRIGKVCSELKAIDATPEQVQMVPKLWDRIWGAGNDIPTLTDTAMISWWPALMGEWEKMERAKTRALEQAVEEMELDDDALPVEENRRRWAEMMAGRGSIVRSME